jgi:spore maturation protein CgeB
MEFRPDFVLTINMSGMDVSGLFARFFEDVQIPYVTWFVDDPRTILMERMDYASPYAVAFTWERSYTASLEAAGFPVVATLPLAVDPHVFNRPPKDTWEHPPSFVGNSMVSYAQHTWDGLRQWPDLAAAVQQSLGEGRVTRQRFARGLHELLAPSCVNSLNAEQRRHAEMTFFVDGTRRLRHAMASALVPEGAVMWGDDGWRVSFPSSGGLLRYSEDMPAFFGGCEVNLNSTSIQMETTVNQRVFDCPAAGGFLLTDYQPVLDELFDVERECAVYRSLDECRELLRFFRAHPYARREITERARARLLGEHTYAHRLRFMAGVLQERFA